MGVNKFVLNTSSGEEVKFDLTGDTVTASDLAYGVTAHGANGEQIIGTMPLDVVRYGIEQTLTDSQKQQARKNIGIKGNGSLIVNFTYSDDGEALTADKPYKELREAVSDGTMLFAEVEGEIYPLLDWLGVGLEFGAYTRTTKGLVKRTIKLMNDNTVTYTDVQVTIDTIRFPSFSGKMLYVDNSGKPRPLKLGTGLKIENGVLMLDGTVTPDTPAARAICDEFLCDEAICEE